jgi:hypothetical protein
MIQNTGRPCLALGPAFDLAALGFTATDTDRFFRSDSTCGSSIASNPYMLTVKHQG